ASGNSRPDLNGQSVSPKLSFYQSAKTLQGGAMTKRRRTGTRREYAGATIRSMSRLFCIAFAFAALAAAQPRPVRLESLQGKTVLLFTPHPDDDTFCCAGTLALMAQNGNNIHIVIYTNDDKGSYDPEMTSERLARIRMGEEEEACRILGIAKENIHWLQFHDGMLEYASPRDLVEEVTGVIRKFRPDVVLSIDPGSEYVRWHKTDHRMA